MMESSASDIIEQLNSNSLHDHLLMSPISKTKSPPLSRFLKSTKLYFKKALNQTTSFGKHYYSLVFAKLPTDKSFAFNQKALLIFAGIILLIIAGSGYALYFISRSNQALNKTASSNNLIDQRIPIEGARATQSVNKDFSFPLYDDKGTVVSKFKYTIDSADLRDQVVVKGQKATAVKGKTFLIINLKLSNDYAKAVSVNARDYLRLVMSGSKDQLAADMHSDPVTIDPASTKLTRLGFSIDDTEKNMQLMVGEIKGQKTTIDLKF